MNATKRFVKKCASIGESFHRWAWNERIGWAASDFAGSHSYKGVSIPNDEKALSLIDRGYEIAMRAEARAARRKAAAAY